MKHILLKRSVRDFLFFALACCSSFELMSLNNFYFPLFFIVRCFVMGCVVDPITQRRTSGDVVLPLKIGGRTTSKSPSMDSASMCNILRSDNSAAIFTYRRCVLYPAILLARTSLVCYSCECCMAGLFLSSYFLFLPSPFFFSCRYGCPTGTSVGEHGNELGATTT